MRVQFTAPLTVTDNYGLKQRGELTVSVAGLIYQPTQFIAPNDDPATGSNSTGNLATIEACQTANDGKTPVLDDGSSATNPAPTPYLDPRSRTVRVGSTLTSMGGILGYGTGSSSTLQDLVNGLNRTMGAGTYVFVSDGNSVQ